MRLDGFGLSSATERTYSRPIPKTSINTHVPKGPQNDAVPKSILKPNIATLLAIAMVPAIA